MKFGILLIVVLVVAACTQQSSFNFGPVGPAPARYYQSEADARAAGWDEDQIARAKRLMRWAKKGKFGDTASPIGPS